MRPYWREEAGEVIRRGIQSNEVRYKFEDPLQECVTCILEMKRDHEVGEFKCS